LAIIGQESISIVIKGINLITLYYTDDERKSMPINYRLDNPLDNKTKNDYLQEMILEIIK
jgi:hypothetical protein